MAGWEEDCCEGVEEERRTGPGLRSLLQPGEGDGPGPVSHYGVVQIWLVSSCLMVGAHLPTGLPRHTEHDEVDHPEDGDGFKGPVVQVDKHQAINIIHLRMKTS